MMYFLSAFVAFLVAFLSSRHLANPASTLYVADLPNHRSLHDTPCPRNGGIAILSGFLLGWMGIRWLTEVRLPGEGFLWSGLVLAVVVSFLDDKYSLSARVRFLIQACAAILLIGGGFSLSELVIPGLGAVPLGWFGSLFSILFIVWMMNLYNFMDGMDGFAGGMGAFGYGFMAFLGWMVGETYFFATALLLAVANVGFLMHNFPAPKSRIFMGDVGSVPMGFLAAGLSLWGVREGIFDFWVAVLIFSPFIVDATITVIRRALMGKKVWHAHHSHYYQRLVRGGWKHRKTVLHEYVLMSGCGGVAVFLQLYGTETRKIIGLACCCLVYVLLALWVDRKTAGVDFG